MPLGEVCPLKRGLHENLERKSPTVLHTVMTDNIMSDSHLGENIN